MRQIKKKIELGQELIPQRKKAWSQKPIFTPRSERCFKKICLEDRFATTKYIKSMLESSDIHASERTVRRRMSDLQFKAYRPAGKPKLTAAMKVKCLNWAGDLNDKNLDFWKSVIICTNIVVFVFSLQNTDQMYYTCLQTVFSTLKHKKLDSSGVFLSYERFASVKRTHSKF